MGQQIFYVITNTEIKIPIDIIHFKEKNCIIFPLLIEDNDYIYKMLESSAHTKNVTDFFEYAIWQFHYEYPTRKVFDFIFQNKIKTFGLIGYREILDIPQNLDDAMLFIDDVRIEFESAEDIETKIHKKLNSDFTFLELVNNEEKYWSFESAEKFYFAQLERNYR